MANLAKPFVVSETDFNYDSSLNCFWYEIEQAHLSSEAFGYYQYLSADEKKGQFVEITEDTVRFAVPDIYSETGVRLNEVVSKNGLTYVKYTEVKAAATAADRRKIAAQNTAIKSAKREVSAVIKKTAIDPSTLKL